MVRNVPPEVVSTIVSALIYRTDGATLTDIVGAFTEPPNRRQVQHWVTALVDQGILHVDESVSPYRYRALEPAQAYFDPHTGASLVPPRARPTSADTAATAPAPTRPSAAEHAPGTPSMAHPAPADRAPGTAAESSATLSARSGAKSGPGSADRSSDADLALPATSDMAPADRSPGTPQHPSATSGANLAHGSAGRSPHADLALPATSDMAPAATASGTPVTRRPIVGVTIGIPSPDRSANADLALPPSRDPAPVKAAHGTAVDASATSAEFGALLETAIPQIILSVMPRASALPYLQWVAGQSLPVVQRRAFVNFSLERLGALTLGAAQRLGLEPAQFALWRQYFPAEAARHAPVPAVASPPAASPHSAPGAPTMTHQAPANRAPGTAAASSATLSARSGASIGHGSADSSSDADLALPQAPDMASVDTSPGTPPNPSAISAEAMAHGSRDASSGSFPPVPETRVPYGTELMPSQDPSEVQMADDQYQAELQRRMTRLSTAGRAGTIGALSEAILTLLGELLDGRSSARTRTLVLLVAAGVVAAVLPSVSGSPVIAVAIAIAVIGVGMYAGVGGGMRKTDRPQSGGVADGLQPAGGTDARVDSTARALPENARSARCGLPSINPAQERAPAAQRTSRWRLAWAGLGVLVVAGLLGGLLWYLDARKRPSNELVRERLVEVLAPLPVRVVALDTTFKPEPLAGVSITFKAILATTAPLYEQVDTWSYLRTHAAAELRSIEAAHALVGGRTVDPLADMPDSPSPRPALRDVVVVRTGSKAGASTLVSGSMGAWRGSSGWHFEGEPLWSSRPALKGLPRPEAAGVFVIGEPADEDRLKALVAAHAGHAAKIVEAALGTSARSAARPMAAPVRNPDFAPRVPVSASLQRGPAAVPEPIGEGNAEGPDRVAPHGPGTTTSVGKVRPQEPTSSVRNGRLRAEAGESGRSDLQGSRGLPPYPAEAGAYLLVEGEWVVLPGNDARVVRWPDGGRQTTEGGGTKARDRERETRDERPETTRSDGRLTTKGGRRMAEQGAEDGRPVADLVFGGWEPIPVIRGADVVVVHVQVPGRSDGDAQWGRGELRNYPMMELMVASSTASGARLAPLQSVAPGVMGFGTARVPAEVVEPRPGITVLRTKSRPPVGNYALLCGTDAYELVVR